MTYHPSDIRALHDRDPALAMVTIMAAALSGEFDEDAERACRFTRDAHTFEQYRELTTRQLDVRRGVYDAPEHRFEVTPGWIRDVAVDDPESILLRDYARALLGDNYRDVWARAEAVGMPVGAASGTHDDKPPPPFLPAIKRSGARWQHRRR